MTFKPWFVDKAFQRWHSVCHLRAFDLVSLRLDVCIWLVCTAIQPLSIALLLSALCTVLAVAALAAHTLAPETYTRHRTAITTARRLLTLPFIKHHCSRQLQQRGPVAAVLQHFLVLNGALLNFMGALFFLDGWHVTAVNSLLGLAVLGPLAGPSCKQLLAGPNADSAAWWGLAAALDKAAGGLFKRQLQQPQMAVAVCRTVATSVQVLLSCASVCATFFIERGFRLRFKQQQLPASVAAMQGHVYSLPLWLELPQMLLTLWAAVLLSWGTAGAWHGLAAV
uniref:Uncharacterized protein n=1 Tax=Tetradesmus obliquus TaxID=3088 RepID=A0A383WJG1_TETOB|eukprot:jgi/Sobl393_1/10877/SZX77551.1